MRSPQRVLSSTLLLSLAIIGACDRGSATTEPEPTFEPQPEQEYVPDPSSEWGDAKLSGIVKLAWGAPVPEDSKLRLTLWHNSNIAQHELIPISGAGPWAFELAAKDTSGFKPEDTFGVGAMIEVPPEGEAWYMGKPPTTQIWKYGVAPGPIELQIIAVDQRVAGEGEPPF